MQGTVKHFNDEKGYGFIEPADLTRDVFVHVSETGGRNLRQGDKVTFTVGTDNQGRPQAKAVTVME